MDFSDHQASIISFLRMAPGAQPILWVFNFTPIPRHGYGVGCPTDGHWREIINSDSMYYGGSNLGNGSGAMARTSGMGGQPYYLELLLPPLAGIALTPSVSDPA